MLTFRRDVHLRGCVSIRVGERCVVGPVDIETGGVGLFLTGHYTRLPRQSIWCEPRISDDYLDALAIYTDELTVGYYTAARLVA